MKSIVKIKVNDIIAKNNIRKEIDEEKLKELANSINQIGLISPITVIKSKENGKYEVVAGYRRLEAIKLLGEDTIEAIIIDVDELSREKIKIDENEIREPVSLVDQAVWIKRLQKKYDMNIEQLQKTLSKSESYIRERLKIAEQDDIIKGIIKQYDMKIGVVTQILRVNNEKRKKQLLDMAGRNGVTEEVAKIWVEQELEHESEDMPIDTSEVVQYEYVPYEAICECCKDAVQLQDIRIKRLCRECWDAAVANLRGR